MNHSNSVAFVFLCAVLHLTLCFSYGDDCLETIIGDTNAYKAPIGGNLQINCTYKYATRSYQNCSVSWFKLENATFVPVTTDSLTDFKLIHLSHLEKILLLCFTNIQKSNAGLYRCKSGLTVGHNIEVTVYGITERGWWMYAYSVAGTIAFVIVVIFISVISMLWCKGDSERETQTGNQNLNLVNQPPSAKSEVTQTSSSSYIYSKVSLDDDNHTNSRTAEGDIVAYAALDHKRFPAASTRPRRPKEECSVYADIRV
nr:uncharacterized protein LOC133594195 [Nerophis lumbriciformis]